MSIKFLVLGGGHFGSGGGEGSADFSFMGAGIFQINRNECGKGLQDLHSVSCTFPSDTKGWFPCRRVVLADVAWTPKTRNKGAKDGTTVPKTGRRAHS